MLPLEAKKYRYTKKYNDNGYSISQNSAGDEIPKSEAKNLLHVVMYEFANVKNQ